MMKVLIMLENNINDAGDNEPFLLEKAMASLYWFKWLEAMFSELNSHKKNGT